MGEKPLWGKPINYKGFCNEWVFPTGVFHPFKCLWRKYCIILHVYIKANGWFKGSIGLILNIVAQMPLIRGKSCHRDMLPYIPGFKDRPRTDCNFIRTASGPQLENVLYTAGNNLGWSTSDRCPSLPYILRLVSPVDSVKMVGIVIPLHVTFVDTLHFS